jgi:esterase/lipase
MASKKEMVVGASLIFSSPFLTNLYTTVTNNKHSVTVLEKKIDSLYTEIKEIRNKQNTLSESVFALQKRQDDIVNSKRKKNEAIFKAIQDNYRELNNRVYKLTNKKGR